ncbi:hypothetical protein Bca4012_043517 [Brassica carinata]|uniref:TF-B3 domain-containing protein n=1 Tax=Brassica carinata TaxID=52824 RepID=A0A8X7QVB7_BRACI|nr:hypothetical protein Bca52824_058823 [Brassica carinata]
MQRVPKAFVDQNSKRLKKENLSVVLMNEEGAACHARLLWMHTGCFILSGWKEFCTRNELQIGDTCEFKLLQSMEEPMFQLCTCRERKKEEQLSSRFVEITPTLYSFEKDKQQLPKRFTYEFHSGSQGFAGPGEEGCSDVLPRVIEEEDCVALTPYSTVSDETSPEPTRPAETGDVQMLCTSVGREAAQYTPLFSNEYNILGFGRQKNLIQTPFACRIQELHFLESSGNTSTASQDSLKGRTSVERFVSTPTSAGQGAVSDQDECSLPSPLVGTNQADLSSANTEGQNIAAETGFVESSAGVAAPGQSATQPVPPVFSDPFPHKLEMLQDIRKNYVEAKSLLKAEFQRRSAELNEQFKRKDDDVEAEYTAKNSDHTSSLRMFSNLQLELDKSQRQSEIKKNYEEEDSLLTAELKRRRAEVYEEFKRKHVDKEAEYTYSQELRPYIIFSIFSTLPNASAKIASHL